MSSALADEARMYWLCAKSIRSGHVASTTLDSLADAADELDVLGQQSNYEQIQDRCIEAVNCYAAQHTALAKVASA